MIQLYKPNSRNTGVCFQMNFDTEDEAMFISMLKQASWDDATKRGSFKANQNDPTKKINAKFTLTEVGAILAAFRRNEELSLFHKVADTSVGIKLSPYIRDVEIPSETLGKSQIVKKQVGYSLGLSRKKGVGEPERFNIGFTFGEAALLEEALVHGLRSVWGAQRASFKKKAAKKETAVETAPEPVVEAAVEEVPAEEIF